MSNKLDLSRALTLSKLKQDIYNFLLSSVTMDNQGMNVYWKRSKNDDFSLVELALQVVREDNNINDYKVVHLSGCKEVLLSLNIGVQKESCSLLS